MASNAKKKTTMAKIARENKLRERRIIKQERKDARRSEAAAGTTADVSAPDDALQPAER